MEPSNMQDSTGTADRRISLRSMQAAILIVTGLGGCSLIVWLIIRSGAADIGRAMLVVGWWLFPITLFHIIPLSFSALAWRELLPPAYRPPPLTMIWIHWIRNSINSLLPVIGIGGDIAGARLVCLQGVPSAQAAACMVVDITVGVVTQLMFVLSGVALLLMHSREHGVVLLAWAVFIGTGLLFAGVAAFFMLQQRGLFFGSAKVLRRLLPEQWLSGWMSDASAIDGIVIAIYRNRGAMLRANILQLMAWVAGTGEIWLVTQALGQPLTVIDAFILESLASGIRAAAFMVPGALGALEMTLVLSGALFGLSPDTAMAISLSKRVREVALGVPGLLVWHWMEGHYLMRAERANAGQ